MSRYVLLIVVVILNPKMSLLTFQYFYCSGKICHFILLFGFQGAMVFSQN